MRIWRVNEMQVAPAMPVTESQGRVDRVSSLVQEAQWVPITPAPPAQIVSRTHRV